MKKIMIFDDDEDILSICTFIFEEQGWQVQTYNNCDAIISRVTTFAPDLILMDNWIPQAGGIAATRQLKADRSLTNIPVVYFSANSDIKLLAGKAGADYFLPKPFDLANLIDMADQVRVSNHKPSS